MFPHPCHHSSCNHHRETYLTSLFSLLSTYPPSVFHKAARSELLKPTNQVMYLVCFNGAHYPCNKAPTPDCRPQSSPHSGSFQSSVSFHTILLFSVPVHTSKSVTKLIPTCMCSSFNVAFPPLDHSRHSMPQFQRHILRMVTLKLPLCPWPCPSFFNVTSSEWWPLKLPLCPWLCPKFLQRSHPQNGDSLNYLSGHDSARVSHSTYQWSEVIFFVCLIFIFWVSTRNTSFVRSDLSVFFITISLGSRTVQIHAVTYRVNEWIPNRDPLTSCCFGYCVCFFISYFINDI